MATIAQLAPTLVAAGLSIKELKANLRPHNSPAAPAPHPISKKRYEQAMKMLIKHPELSDATIAKNVTTITPSIVASLRAEVEAVQAKLAALDPVDEGVDPDSGLVSVTFDASTNRVIKNKHGLDDGNKIQLHITSGASGLSDGVYYVVNANGNNFKLSLTEGGSIESVGSDGEGEYMVIQ